ncbi:MAG TPA: elongation factor P [Candidatus Binatia bacterium]|nr:elongation factor P [Candidatus Binatia bacterium]
MASLSATQLRAGMIIQHRDAPHRILDLTHVTPGNWRGFVRTKLRNLRTGLQTEHRFRSEEQVERIVLDQREMEYLYQAGNDYHFMEAETYEQVVLSRETLGDAVLYLTPNLKLRVDFYEGQPVSLSLPKTVDLQVKDTPPGMKTATVATEMKPATLETGLEIRVPSFISPGEMVRVDTETGEYLSRVK